MVLWERGAGIKTLEFILDGVDFANFNRKQHNVLQQSFHIGEIDHYCLAPLRRLLLTIEFHAVIKPWSYNHINAQNTCTCSRLWESCNPFSEVICSFRLICSSVVFVSCLISIFKLEVTREAHVLKDYKDKGTSILCIA